VTSAGSKSADQRSDGPAATPADEIGGRVAAYRAQRGTKVSELARQVGVSPSLISQIERGQSRPSVSTLFAMSEALGVPVDAFFRASGEDPQPARHGQPVAPAEPGASGAAAAQGPGDHRYVVRKGHRAALDIEGGVRWERLTPSTLDRVEFLELVYGPHAESNPTLYRHPGTEMVLMLSGRLDIYVGFDRHELDPGDSIHFPSSLPHRYVNPTDETARAVTVILHDEHGETTSQTQRRP
jgi:transcriptional regulator with XRE-family HTH domain/quercetin dioxygenase-like cupin family protein